MEIISSSIIIISTYVSFSVYKNTQKIKNIYHSLENGYGIDSREGYPY
jgi:hypothetical protein